MVMPCLFICHGGGPMPLLPPEPGTKGRSSMHNDSLTAEHLRTIPSLCPAKPTAILVVSAHWEEGHARLPGSDDSSSSSSSSLNDDGDICVSVTASARPPMLFDYGGFPPETYEYSYPAAGSPALARRVQELLEQEEGGAKGDGGELTPLAAVATTGAVAGSPAGEGRGAKKRGWYRGRRVRVRLDDERGFDHGVFVPLLLAFPDADVPVVCLSLHRSLDPALHLAIGERLRPLRREGVLLLGSGVSFHNMSVLMRNWGAAPVPRERAAGAAFDAYLRRAVLGDAQQQQQPGRAEASSSSNSDGGNAEEEQQQQQQRQRGLRRFRELARWKAFPGASEAHPREEHLMPLLVCAGAGGGDEAAVIFEDVCMGAAMTGFQFG